jgi:hypothetical protein
VRVAPESACFSEKDIDDFDKCLSKYHKIWGHKNPPNFHLDSDLTASAEHNHTHKP